MPVTGKVLLRVPALVMFLYAGSAFPADRMEFDYDVFVLNDTLSFWLDVTPVLTQPRLEDLLAGLEICIEVEVTVQQPRFPWDRAIDRSSSTLSISHSLTEDYYALQITGHNPVWKEFTSQLLLADYLADSLVWTTCPTNQINGDDHLRLALNITCNTLSSKVLQAAGTRRESPPGTAEKDDDDLFKDIFSLFVRVTGYGRDQYHLESPSFTLSEVPVYDR